MSDLLRSGYRILIACWNAIRAVVDVVLSLVARPIERARDRRMAEEFARLGDLATPHFPEQAMQLYDMAAERLMRSTR